MSGAVVVVAASLTLAGAALQSERAAAAGEVTPSGFRDNVVISRLSQPTNLRFAPNGHIFIAQKNGTILEYDSFESQPKTVVALNSEVDNYWDRGLLGLAIDPNFVNGSPYIYALYTYDAPPNQTAPVWNDGCPAPPGPTTDGCVVTGKLVRIRVDPTSSTLVGSPATLISNEWCQQFPSHSIGDLQFGPDGKLYVSGGEGANFNANDYGQFGGSSGSQTPANPCGDPPAGVGGIETPPMAEGGMLRSQSLRRPAGEPVVLDGALLRLDPATGNAAAGNPITTGESNAQRIIDYGFRNPYRFVFRPGTSEIWVADVGQATWEEINRITSLTTVSNFGWPCYEGVNPKPSFQQLGLNLCSSLYTSGVALSPYYTYNHNSSVVTGDNCSFANGSVISALSFYNGSAFPSGYNGALFFGDHARRCIWAMLPGPNGLPDPNNVALFDNVASNPVDIEQTPDGNLVYLDHDNGQIHEITYQAETCTAGEFTAQYFNNSTLAGGPTLGRCDASIDFSWGSGSPDPTVKTDDFSARWTGNFTFTSGTYTFSASTDDGVRLWVDNDLVIDNWRDQSTTTKTGSITLAGGTHTVKVEYYEGTGSAEAHVSWSPGTNTPPAPVIDTPSSSLTYAVGDTITFSGHGTDAQDGTLGSSALTWTLLIHHCTSAGCHTHAVQTWTGTPSGSFQAPDHEYPSHLELALSATDSGGVETTTSVALQPKTTTLTLTSVPSGLTLSFDNRVVTTPDVETVIQNSTNAISAASPASMGGTTYTFSSWSNGQGQAQVVTAPASTSGATYTATYSAGGGTPSVGGSSGGGAAAADLALAVSTRFAQVSVGGLNDLTATITNNGSAAATGTHFRFTLPSSLQLQGPPLYQTGSGCIGIQTVDCNLDYIPSGGTSTVSFEVRATGSGVQTIEGALTSDRDADVADNAMSVVFDVTPASSPAYPSTPVRVTLRPVTLAPKKLLRGSKVTAVAGIFDTANHALRPTRSTCTVRIAGRTLKTRTTFRLGRASCVFTIPARTRHKASIVGTISVTASAGKASRAFRAVVW